MIGNMVDIESQVQEFADLYGAEITKLKKVPGKDKKSVQKKEAREKLVKRKVSVEEMFTASSDKVELAKQKLSEREKLYKEQSACTLETVSGKSDMLDKLQHRQKQLLLYIEEKERESLPDSERVEPIGESCSEESLSNTSGKTYPKHKHPKATMKHVTHARTISDPHMLRPDSKTQLAVAQVHQDQRPGSPRSLSPRDKSPRLGHKDSSEKKVAKRPSLIAEQVTARLYNAEQIKKHADTHGGARRKTTQLSSSTEEKGLHSRSKSAPLLDNAMRLTSGLAKSAATNRMSPSSPSTVVTHLIPSCPRLKNSTSSLASVPEFIDETFKDSDRHDTLIHQGGKESSVDPEMDDFGHLSSSYPESNIKNIPRSDLQHDESLELGIHQDIIVPVLHDSQLTSTHEPKRKRPKMVEAGTPVVNVEPIAMDTREDGSGEDGIVIRASPDGVSNKDIDASCSRPVLEAAAEKLAKVPQSAKHIPSSETDRKKKDKTFHKKSSPSDKSKKSTKTAGKSEKDSKTPETHRRRNSDQEIRRSSQSPLPSPRGRGMDRYNKDTKRPGSGPAALGQRKSPRTERSSSKESAASSRSVSREGSIHSDRSMSRESMGSLKSDRSTSRDSTGSLRSEHSNSRESMSSIKSERSVSKDSVSSREGSSLSRPSSGSSGKTKSKNSGDKKSKKTNDIDEDGKKKVKKASKKRDNLKGDQLLSKPKKKHKSVDIPVEFFMAGSGGAGGGDGTSLNIGLADHNDLLRPNTDPAHEIFAKSLRSDNIPEKEFRPFTEGLYPNEDGTFHTISYDSTEEGRPRSRNDNRSSRRKPDGYRSTGDDSDSVGRLSRSGSVASTVSAISTRSTKSHNSLEQQSGSHQHKDNNEYSDDSLDGVERVSPEGQHHGDDELTEKYLQTVKDRLQSEEHVFSEDSLDDEKQPKHRDGYDADISMTASDQHGRTINKNARADVPQSHTGKTAPVVNITEATTESDSIDQPALINPSASSLGVAPCVNRAPGSTPDLGSSQHDSSHQFSADSLVEADEDIFVEEEVEGQNVQPAEQQSPHPANKHK